MFGPMLSFGPPWLSLLLALSCSPALLFVLGMAGLVTGPLLLRSWREAKEPPNVAPEDPSLSRPVLTVARWRHHPIVCAHPDCGLPFADADLVIYGTEAWGAFRPGRYFHASCVIVVQTETNRLDGPIGSPYAVVVDEARWAELRRGAEETPPA